MFVVLRLIKQVTAERQFYFSSIAYLVLGPYSVAFSLQCTFLVQFSNSIFYQTSDIPALGFIPLIPLVQDLSETFALEEERGAKGDIKEFEWI